MPVVSLLMQSLVKVCEDFIFFLMCDTEVIILISFDLPNTLQAGVPSLTTITVSILLKNMCIF